MYGIKCRASLRENCVRLRKPKPGRRFPSLQEEHLQQCKVQIRACSRVKRQSQSPDLNRFYESLAVLENCASQLLSIPSDWTGAIFCQRRMGKNPLWSMSKAGRDPPLRAFNCNCSKACFDKVWNSRVQNTCYTVLSFYFYFFMQHFMLTRQNKNPDKIHKCFIQEIPEGINLFFFQCGCKFKKPASVKSM